ncbi:amino acid adenylation domain-containing protein [Micromonospora sediminicola]|uniref:Amino acid adenylation domain-containing protein n=1 Tax=Micromonospora sediminicola TaxID=946078 RepID=A0A1A9B9F7_9ACTN|nr:non-ribosomal peptide synthetase [Micromonospora sediminicola]SBT65706.1 amino acid adenylation domain-containing protein [Micromonospora sediminicola]
MTSAGDQAAENDGGSPFGRPDGRGAEPAGILPDLVRAQAQRSPDTVAVESAGDRLTYRQVVAHAAALAAHLRRMGVGQGEPVAVAVPRGVDLVPALLGVQLAGAAYVPLDPEHPTDRLNHILRDAGVRFLVTADPASTPGLHAAVSVHLDDVVVPTDPPPLAPLDPDSAAYAIYTSGSTGQPKGVLVTHRALANFIHSMRSRPGLPDDVVLPAVTTVSFDIAALELFLPLTSGGRVVVARQDEVADPRQLTALLTRTGARALQATPVTWRLLLEAGWSPPPGFTVLCGGERLTPDLAERLLGEGVVLWDLYGPTETTIWSAVTRFERGVEPEFHPVRETSLHLLDERLSPVAPGGAGDLYIGGAGLAAGYLGRPALTAERFVADPFAGSAGGRLYRTGDIARHHPDGRIEILGRGDDQLKIRGFRVEPGEIEAALVRYPGVAQAAVRAIDDLGGFPRLVGYVRPADPADPPESRRLHLHLARSLPPYMVPTQFVVLDAFPTTPNGKLDRSALPAPPTSAPTDPTPRSAGLDGAAPDGAGPTESQVTEVLAAVLGRPEIGLYEDFFALGGDSLRAVQAVLLLNGRLNRQVPINALFEARTAYGLAVLLDGDDTPEPPLVALPSGHTSRLSSAQWRLWLHQQRVPDSAADNRPLVVRLPGPLDLAALEAAVTGLLARHEILRTRYRYDDSGQPALDVQQAEPVSLEVEEDDPERVLSAELSRPFDLEKELPIRFRVVRCADEDATLLLLVLHQIAADNRSRGLIAKQVRWAYRGRAVADPPLRYTDYTEWQREMAASPAVRRHLDFWRTALARLEQADLITDRPRTPSRDWRCGTVRFAVPAAVVGRLRDVAFTYDTTTRICLLTAFYAVLARRCRGTDLTVGTPVGGRHRPELNDLVGMFEDTAVIRVDVGDHPTFAGLLTRVRDAAVAAHSHALLPFEDIVAAVLDVVATMPAPGRNPLVDTMFAVHGIAADPPGFPMPDAPGTNVDLRCELTEQADGGIDGRLEFATRLFDRATIDRLADGYLRLLGEMADDPSRPVEQVAVLDGA